jgi:hypothetical protein
VDKCGKQGIQESERGEANQGGGQANNADLLKGFSDMEPDSRSSKSDENYPGDR